MTSYLKYRQHLRAVLDNDSEIESWITVKGNHIPIKKGQSKEEAVEHFLERQKAEKNKEKHEALYKKHNERYETMKEEILKYQKKFDEMWTSYEDYRNNPEMKQLALENNLRRNVLASVKKMQDKEEAFVKKYQDILNKIDNSETDFSNSGVAKKINFGKMPVEQAKEAIENLKKLQDKYPYMKGKLDFIGSQDTEDFKSWYKNLIIETQVVNDYARIIGGIENAKEVVAGWDSLPEINKREPYYITRYESAKKILKEVEEHGEDEYARRWVETHYRTTKRFTSRIWAYYVSSKDGQKGSIVFNSNNYNSHGNASGDWHPVGCDTQKSVLDHEFGHSIYYALKLDKAFGNAEDTPLGKLRNFIVGEFVRNSKEYIRKNLSMYASTDLSEFFAEAFAEYENNPEPRHIAKTVGEYLEQYKKELEDGTDERRHQERLKEILK